MTAGAARPRPPAPERPPLSHKPAPPQARPSFEPRPSGSGNPAKPTTAPASAPTTPTPAIPEPPTTTLRGPTPDEILADPLVRTVLDVFEGEVKRIHPRPKRADNAE